MVNQESGWDRNEQLKKVEEVIQQEEGVTRSPNYIWTIVITVIAVSNSLFAMYVAVGTMTTQILRAIHVAVVLTLIFLHYPASKRHKTNVSPIDIILIILSIFCVFLLLPLHRCLAWVHLKSRLWGSLPANAPE